jgi:hypothetical protein
MSDSLKKPWQRGHCALPTANCFHLSPTIPKASFSPSSARSLTDIVLISDGGSAFTGTDENANQTRAIIGKPHKKVPKPLCLPLTFKCGWRAMTVGSPLPALTAVHTISFPCNRSRRNPSFTFHPMRRVPVMHEHISL